MAGDDRAVQLATYLTRLLGEPVSAGQPLRLRSVHRAALASWARKEGLPIRLSAIRSGEPFILDDLLTADPGGTPAAPSVPGPAGGMAWPPTGQVRGVGIDIESVDALPQADDYREHPFFRDNFAAAEIAHCIGQPDTRASLCGIWAAKEAALKAGFPAGPSGRLDGIVVGHDPQGRPTMPGCALSISHTAATAVAICIVTPGTAAVAAPSVARPAITAESAPMPQGYPALVRIAAACAVAALFGGTLMLALRAWS